MEPFLKSVAKDIYKKFGADLSRTVLVFPNKRARLFFNQYLAQETAQPIWAPTYLSINELFAALSPLKTADHLKLVCDLHKVFAQETESDEPMDEFYFWGELLLNDFDDVDKNLADGERLFSNLADLKQLMNGNDFLNEEQEAAIQQFFRNFSIERHTELKEKFIHLWKNLGIIYHRYKTLLASQGIAYEGMLYRDAIERLSPASFPYHHYAFVGFNLLTPAERKLFDTLQYYGKAIFYWDYDQAYIGNKNHEAGKYLLHNLKRYPNELPPTLFDSLNSPKKVCYIAASTENAQARYIAEWIRESVNGEEKENAVVLCNEALLQPVLHAVPPHINHLNITMGYPLIQTPVFSFLTAVTDLHIAGYHAKSGRFLFNFVQAVLKHPYTRYLSGQAEKIEKELRLKNRFYPLPSELCQDEFLRKLFTPELRTQALCAMLSDLLATIAKTYREKEEENIFIHLYQEALFKGFTTINRFHSLLESSELDIRPETFRKLLQKALAGISIPFHGEPAIGLQVMGLLETRNLDFRNIVLLSVNEGLLPGGGKESSFIPYNLRKAFGLTTPEHKDALFAYYFYRLLQRAENITLLYNNSSDGLNRGEWSRFMLQFLIEWPHPIRKKFLTPSQSLYSVKSFQVDKNPVVMQKIHHSYNLAANGKYRVSPSALNTYLDCRIKFYFRYIAGLTPPEEATAEIDSALFGSIFHRAAELVYNDLTALNEVINKANIERFLKNPLKIEQYVDEAFKEIFFKIPAKNRSEYNGTQLINLAVISMYITQLLKNDLNYTPFRMIGMEVKVEDTLTIKTSAGEGTIRIGGTIDRIDCKEDTLRIVDYKTGGAPKSPVNIAQLFTPDEMRPNYIFQTFLYASIMHRQQTLKVAPALLYIHRAASETYSPVIKIGESRKKEPIYDFAPYDTEFRQRLTTLLEEIFDPEIPFVQTAYKSHCEYCDFKSLCKS